MIEPVNQNCCSYQNIVMAIIGAAAITVIAIGILSLSSVHGQNLSTAAKVGMLAGGSVTLVILVCGKIYLKSSLPPEEDTVEKTLPRVFQPVEVTIVNADWLSKLGRCPANLSLQPKQIFLYRSDVRVIMMRAQESQTEYKSYHFDWVGSHYESVFPKKSVNAMLNELQAAGYALVN